MSGESVAYHLRLNKFIERELFFELLQEIQPGVPERNLSLYSYASMGGRFMEDLKLANHRLGIKDLFCIEKDDVVFGRQLFNKPVSWIVCRNESSEDFVNDFGSICDKLNYKNFIVWLDYAAANKRGSQLSELQSLVSQLADYDIVKVTINADLKTLLGRSTSAEETDEVVSIDGLDKAKQDALTKLERQLGEYMPTGYSADRMRNDELPALMADAVRIAAVKGMQGRNRSKIVPLAIYKYSDGHQMLTVTAIVLPIRSESDFFEATKVNNWDFFSVDWQDIHQISVPDLSLREKLEIDSKLGKHPPEKIHRKIPFKLHRRRERSLEILKNYVLHSERYPSFGRYIT